MPPRRPAPLFTPQAVRKGVWFPLLLGFMLLLAVPGMIFLALSLLGKETAVNGWMREHLGLSYHIPIPWWAGLILLLTPFLILLLYFLKMKRKPLQVPSTFLWKKSIEDLHVNSLFQWMRDNVLLLMQLLIVLLLIYGVMAFQVYAGQGTGRHYILLVDNSASMSIADAEDGATRLEAAKKAALHEIGAHGDGDVGMVIEFSSTASIRQPYTIDRDKLRRAVENIEPTQRATHIEEALNLADSLANPLRSTDDMAVRPDNADPTKARTYVPTEGVAAEVHLFSDGRFPDVAGFAAGSLDINYHRIGAADDSDNLGIVALNARRDDKGTSNLQVFVRVLNFRNTDVQTQVKLDEMDWKDGELKVVDSHIKPLSLKSLTVSAVDADKKETPTRTAGEGSLTFALNNIDDGSNRVLHASLLDVKDAFSLDNDAWLVVGVVRKARVLIVTDGNEILHDFFDLDATQKVAIVSYITPADLKDQAKYLRPARAGAFDLVIFDRCAPENEEATPLANTYTIDDVPPPWKRGDMPELKEAQIRNPTSKHPLMAHLTGLDEIAFSDAFRFELDPDKNPNVPARVPKLMETERAGAVLFALPRRSFTDLVQTFPLVNAKGQWTSNWNLKLSFPLFLRNVLYQLGNVSDAAAEENLQPGQIKTLRPDVIVKDGDPADAGVKEIKVWDAAKKVSHTVQPGASKDFLYKDTEDIGVYLATWEGGRRGFAVNLLDADESDIRPRDEVKIGDQVLASGPTRGQPSDLWPWAALAALVLLVVEWALYYFRIFG
jgi:von Willebrand factor type A domain/Aerotolerance regulator N-terminal